MLLFTTVCFTHFSSPLCTLVIAGEFNGHVGQHSQGFNRHHGGYGYGTANQEGMRILDICAANDLALTNTFFKIINSQLVTYNSPIWLHLVRRTDMKLVKNAKINGNEECIPQYNLVVAVFKIQTPS